MFIYTCEQSSINNISLNHIPASLEILLTSAVNTVKPQHDEITTELIKTYIPPHISIKSRIRTLSHKEAILQKWKDNYSESNNTQPKLDYHSFLLESGCTIVWPKITPSLKNAFIDAYIDKYINNLLSDSIERKIAMLKVLDSGRLRSRESLKHMQFKDIPVLSQEEQEFLNMTADICQLDGYEDRYTFGSLMARRFEEGLAAQCPRRELKQEGKVRDIFNTAADKYLKRKDVQINVPQPTDEEYNIFIESIKNSIRLTLHKFELIYYTIMQESCILSMQKHTPINYIKGIKKHNSAVLEIGEENNYDTITSIQHAAIMKDCMKSIKKIGSENIFDYMLKIIPIIKNHRKTAKQYKIFYKFAVYLTLLFSEQYTSHNDNIMQYSIYNTLNILINQFDYQRCLENAQQTNYAIYVQKIVNDMYGDEHNVCSLEQVISTIMLIKTTITKHSDKTRILKKYLQSIPVKQTFDDDIDALKNAMSKMFN